MDVIGVVGAGIMGSGIAQVSALGGYRVMLSDVDVDRATKGKDGIAKQFAKLVERGKMAADDADAALARITPVGDNAAMADAALVIDSRSASRQALAFMLRKAQERGLKSAKLRELIDTKEKLLGGGESAP